MLCESILSVLFARVRMIGWNDRNHVNNKTNKYTHNRAEKNMWEYSNNWLKLMRVLKNDKQINAI